MCRILLVDALDLLDDASPRRLPLDLLLMLLVRLSSRALSLVPSSVELLRLLRPLEDDEESSRRPRVL